MAPTLDLSWLLAGLAAAAVLLQVALLCLPLLLCLGTVEPRLFGPRSPRAAAEPAGVWTVASVIVGLVPALALLLGSPLRPITAYNGMLAVIGMLVGLRCHAFLVIWIVRAHHGRLAAAADHLKQALA